MTPNPTIPSTQGEPKTLGDMMDYIGVQAHLIRLQDQIIHMGKHILKLQERIDILEVKDAN